MSETFSDWLRGQLQYVADLTGKDVWVAVAARRPFRDADNCVKLKLDDESSLWLQSQTSHINLTDFVRLSGELVRGTWTRAGCPRSLDPRAMAVTPSRGSVYDRPPRRRERRTPDFWDHRPYDF